VYETFGSMVSVLVELYTGVSAGAKKKEIIPTVLEVRATGEAPSRSAIV